MGGGSSGWGEEGTEKAERALLQYSSPGRNKRFLQWNETVAICPPRCQIFTNYANKDCLSLPFRMCSIPIPPVPLPILTVPYTLAEAGSVPMTIIKCYGLRNGLSVWFRMLVSSARATKCAAAADAPEQSEAGDGASSFALGLRLAVPDLFGSLRAALELQA